MPMPKTIVSQSAATPQLFRSAGRSCISSAGDDRSPQAVDAAHQHHGEQGDRVAGGEGRDEELAGVRRQQPPGDARQERRERERPQLVERDVDAGGQRGRFALPDGRPRTARPGAHVDERDQEHDGGHDHHVAQVGGVAAGDGRPADVRVPAVGLQVAQEPMAAVREVRGPEHHRDGAGEHQRDQRQVEAAEPQGRQPDERAQDRRDQARQEQHDRERQARWRRTAERRPTRRGRAARSARATRGRSCPSGCRAPGRRWSRSRPTCRR